MIPCGSFKPLSISFPLLFIAYCIVPLISTSQFKLVALLYFVFYCLESNQISDG